MCDNAGKTASATSDAGMNNLCGDRDPYPDQPEVLRGMANFREAPQIPGAACFVHWEKPVEFTAAVRAFLRTFAIKRAC